MAKFTDLSNELVIAIASFIGKPADILQLCIAERRTYELIQPLLYENVVFNHIHYPNHISGIGSRSMSSKIHLFCRCIKQQLKENSRRNRDGPSFGIECRSLAIDIGERLTWSTYDVMGVCEFVPFLRSFSLISNTSLEKYTKARRLKDRIPQFGDLGQALRPLRHTLESLTLFLHHQDHCWAQKSLGILQSFAALKKLRIQSRVLLGGGSGSRDNRAPALLLSQILPPDLEDLTLHCCVDDLGSTDEKGDFAHHVEASLDGKSFSTRSFEADECLAETDRRVIESVVVCLLDSHLCDSPANASLILKKSFGIVGRKV